MSTTSESRSSQLATVERTVEETPGGFVATIRVTNAVDRTVVARIVDELPAHAAIEGIMLHPETEPARWGLEDHTLVLEMAVGPGTESTVRYELESAALPDALPAVRVELAQPVDHDVETDDEVPCFRDTLSFASAPAGSFVSTTEQPADATEASDDDVREAIRAVSDSDPEEFTVTRRPTIDLADPPD